MGDRTAQLEAMPTHAPNAEANTELLRRVKVRVSRKIWPIMVLFKHKLILIFIIGNSIGEPGSEGKDVETEINGK